MKKILVVIWLAFLTMPLFCEVVKSDVLTSRDGISYAERQRSNYIQKNGYAFSYLGNGTWDVSQSTTSSNNYDSKGHSAPHNKLSLTQYDEQRINKALNAVWGKWKDKDWNGDGQVNCIDRCMSFAREWGRAYEVRYIYWKSSPKPHLTVRVPANDRNGKTHLVDIDPAFSREYGGKEDPNKQIPRAAGDDNLISWGVYRRSAQGTVLNNWWYE